MVRIYAANVSGLPDPKEIPQMIEGLPEKRKEKILRYRFVEKRIQGLGAGLLLEYVLQFHGKCSKDIRFGENGKPELDNFFFNLSHAGDIVICAVSDKDVGCDVEKVSTEPKGIAEKFFCISENEHLNHLEGMERVDEFFRIWTLKESYMKMTGEGMRLELNRMEFIFDTSVKVYRDGALCPCAIKEYAIPGYKCSVCSADVEFAKDLIWVNLLEGKSAVYEAKSEK